MNFKVRLFIFLLGVTLIYVLLMVSWNFSIDFPPCACEKCLSEDDPWFMQFSNKSVEPFLSSKDNLSEDAFNWWKRLQRERRNFSFYNKTMNNLFQVLPSLDLTEPSPDRCRTCAVVGNSVNLKQSYYGPLIDLHDVIIRINRGRTKGYERDVGTRTTHQLMYPESAMDLDNTTHLMMAPFKIRDLEWLIGFFGASEIPLKPNIKANKNLVKLINPAFIQYVHEIWLGKKGRYPSTGFIAVILSLHICDEVDVFGYGADKDGNWSHYWEVLRNKKLKTGQHAGTHEYNMIKKLAEKQKLKFYTGW